MLLPHLPPSLHRGGTRRLRGAALPRPPHRAAAQGGEGVRGGRRRPIPCPARRAPCATKFESVVRGNATLAGTIFPGQIPALSGFSAQDIFLWFPVLAIGLDDNASGIIHLDVGVVNKRFPLSLFEFPPDCTRSPLSLSCAFNKLDQDVDGKAAT
ncbi:hypothetical protein OPV22_006472 [Ensete ventricosum]|uniref:Xylanase inhibitor C-terminal domain-containing protein n=1 Tax=Ensete ventricosum TaxID=4639 RepID=A0AAV8Q5S6_ENSVE|nr:hypothetical protein OPV22_006472 [Ensete ventricosum]